MPAPCGEVPAMMILSQHTISERLARGRSARVESREGSCSTTYSSRIKLPIEMPPHDIPPTRLLDMW